MRHLSGYGAYKLFLALRTHFHSEKYDFVKFQGKIKASKEAYESRHDKLFFEKLARQYDAMELRDLFLANFLIGRHYSVDLSNEEAYDAYIQFKKRKESLGYTFSNDLKKVFAEDHLAFRCQNGNYPQLLMLYLQNEVSIETLCVLEKFVCFSDQFDKRLGENDVIWQPVKFCIKKYTPFIKYDYDKMKTILKEVIDSVEK